MKGCSSRCLPMHISRKSIIQTEVRPPVIVEPHGLPKCRFGLSLRTKDPVHFVFLFEYSVDPLRQGVLVTVHHLGHADRQTPRLQPLDILRQQY